MTWWRAERVSGWNDSAKAKNNSRSLHTIRAMRGRVRDDNEATECIALFGMTWWSVKPFASEWRHDVKAGGMAEGERSECGCGLVWGDLFLRCHSEPAAFWPCEESAVRLSGVWFAFRFGFGNQSEARSFQRGLLRCISHSFLSRRHALICFSRAMARRMSPNIS